MKGKELAEWLYTMELQNTNGRENEDEMFMKGIEVGIAHFAEPQWISVKDRVPNHNSEVLVLAPDCNIIGSVLIGKYFKAELSYPESWNVFCFRESKINEIVTHWMELPTPPKH